MWNIYGLLYLGSTKWKLMRIMCKKHTILLNFRSIKRYIYIYICEKCANFCHDICKLNDFWLFTVAKDSYSCTSIPSSARFFFKPIFKIKYFIILAISINDILFQSHISCGNIWRSIYLISMKLTWGNVIFVPETLSERCILEKTTLSQYELFTDP